MSTDYYEKLYQDFSKELQLMPEGRLRYKRNKDSFSFYCASDIGDKTQRRSIGGKRNLELRNNLRRKECILIALEKIERLISIYKQADEIELSYNADLIMKKAIDNAPTEGWHFDGIPHVGNLSIPIINSYNCNPPHPEALCIDTNLGFKVRSKAELLIARALYSRGIQFYYERPIRINGHMFFPDFTIINSNGEIIIWEHFGLTENEYYLKATTDKLNCYLADGFVLSKTLFLSSENRKNPLNQKTIDQIIDQIENLL